MPGHESSQSPEYITLRQAVDLGYAGYSTLRKYIADGRLPAVRGGRTYQLRLVDLDTLISSDSSTVDAAIARIVSTAPSLTVEQIRRIGSVLHTPGGVS